MVKIESGSDSSHFSSELHSSVSLELSRNYFGVTADPIGEDDLPLFSLQFQGGNAHISHIVCECSFILQRIFLNILISNIGEIISVLMVSTSSASQGLHNRNIFHLLTEPFFCMISKGHPKIVHCITLALF